MQPAELPEDVQKLLRDHIGSYEQLELLLVLRANSDTCWTREALGARLRIPEALVIEALTALGSAGFVGSLTQDGRKGYAYRIHRAEVEATVARLARAYKDQPMSVIKLMSANAIERVRTAALRTFAEAFILRKDKDDR